jgi:hypothetical protein
MAPRQMTFGLRDETNEHIEAAKEMWPAQADHNSDLMRALVKDWYQLHGWNHDQLDAILEEAAGVWPEMAGEKGMLLRKIAVEWSRNRGDARRHEIADRLAHIEELLRERHQDSDRLRTIEEMLKQALQNAQGGR